jgi:hypothetical protein
MLSTRKNHRFFIFSWIIWSVNIVLILLSYLSHEVILFMPILFVITLIPFGYFAIKMRRKQFFDWNSFLYKISKPMKVAVVLSIAYTAINLVINFYLLREGGPQIVDGVYCIWNHGLIREITEAEYIKLQYAEARLFTGQLLVFSAIPMAYFSSTSDTNTSDEVVTT